MGWWRSGRTPDDVLGDGPADAVQQELGRLAASAQAKPTFQALVDGLAEALRNDARELLSTPGEFRGGVIARFEPPASAVRSRQGTANPAVVDVLASALKRIAGEYELELSRKPTLGEVLGTLAFVLRVRPERYLSGAEDLKLIDLSPTTDHG